MKKSLAILFSVLMLSLPLVSCGGEDTDTEPTYPIELIGVWEGVSVETDGEVTIKPGEEGETADAEVTDISNVRIAIDMRGFILVVERENANLEWKEKASGLWLYRSGDMLFQFKQNEIHTAKVKKLDNFNLVLAFTTETKADDGTTARKETTTYSFRRVTQ